MKIKNEDRTFNFVEQDGDVHGKVHVKDLGPKFVKDKNVRDAELGYDTENFCSKLASDGKVLEAVHVCMDCTVEEFMGLTTYAKIVGSFSGLDPLKGFRRSNCSLEVYENPDKYIGEFDPYIPVVFKFGMTQAQRLHHKLDHSQNRGLNDYELGLCIKQEVESGVARTNKEIVCEHQSLFEAALANSQRSDLQNKLQNRQRLANPIADLNNKQDLIFKFFKGRFQRLQRIFTGPNSEVLMENYRRKIYGLKDDMVVRITDNEALELWKEQDPNVFEDKWGKLKKEQEEKALEGTKPNYKWTKKTYEEKIDAFRIARDFGTILDGVFGDKEAQERFTKVRDRMVKIQHKLDQDPDKFWEFIG